MEEKGVVLVKKSNDIARGSWQINNVNEARIVALIAGRIRCEDEDFKTYEIPVQEILGESSGGNDYKRLEEIADGLMGRVITIGSENKRGFAKYALFSACRYIEKRGVLELRFDKDLKPHYLNLGKFFTQYSLAEYMALPSTYSQRLFEIMHSCKPRKEFTFTVEQLHEMLKTPISLRSNFKDFNNRVLKPALRHISEHTTLFYSYEPIKKGRKYHEIKFVFTRKKQALIVKKDKKAVSIKTGKRTLKQAEMMKECLKCWEKQGNKCDNSDKSKHCDFCRATVQQ